jgi:hypothetical protein
MTDLRGVAIHITGTAGDVSGGDMQKTITTTTTTGDGATRDDVTAQLAALVEMLRASPPAHTDAAAAITSIANVAVQEATKATPNRLLTHISADGLIAAATQIAAAMPTVMPLAQRLADALRGMVA